MATRDGHGTVPYRNKKMDKNYGIYRTVTNFKSWFYGTEILKKTSIFMVRYGTVPRHTAKNKLRYHKIKVAVRREKNYGTTKWNNVVPGGKITVPQNKKCGTVENLGNFFK